MFGIPNSDTGSGSSKFLGRLQVDARVGAWTIVQRKTDGQSYYDDKSDPFFANEREPLTFMADFASLEVGYIKFATPPDFRVVPFGGTIPDQPAEMTAPDPTTGRVRKAFQPGFRLQIYAPKRMGPEPLYFSNSGKGVMAAMDELHQQYLAAPEAAKGMIPAVSVTSMKKIETTTPKGKNTTYSPNFVIKSWHERPDVFGEATVSADEFAKSTPTQRPTASANPPANHAPPPARKPQVTSEQVYGVQGGMPEFGTPSVITGALVDDEIPWAPCVD